MLTRFSEQLRRYLPAAKVAVAVVLLSATLGLFRGSPPEPALWAGAPPPASTLPPWIASAAQGWYPAVIETFANMYRLSVRSSAAYLLVCGACALTFFAIPFLSNGVVRMALSAVLLAGVCVDLILYDIGDEFPGPEAIDTIVSNARFGLEGTAQLYADTILCKLALAIACFVVFALQPPPRLSARPWPVVVVVSGIGGVGAMLWLTDGSTRSYPSPFATYISVYSSLRDARPQPIGEVRYPSRPKSPYTKIVLIIDESVRGDYLSLNDRARRTTPFLLSQAHDMANFGVAVSAANCSVASRIALRFGLREAELTTPLAELEPRATLWQYARVAGFETVHVDTFGTQVHLTNGLSAAERRLIDNRIVIQDTPSYLRDERVADRLSELMRDPRPMFILAEKFGSHIPYDKMYPPSANLFGADARTPFSMGNGPELMRHYENALAWSVDAFFARLLKDGLPPATLVLYTSDHGQSLSATKTSHCHTGRADKGEAMVPLFAMSTDPQWKTMLAEGATLNFGRAGAEDIFPTMLVALGYDRKWVAEQYGLSLLDKIPSDRRRRFLTGRILQSYDMP